MKQEEKKYFGLLSKVYLIKGAVRGAIYDTNSGDIFSINKEASNCLAALVNGETIKEVIGRANGRADDLVTWLRQLEQNYLGLYIDDKPLTPELPPKPEQQLDFIWLELTKGCNLHCLHCYDGSSPELIKKEKELTHRMLHKDWQSVIGQAADLEVRKLQFIGGEPLLYKRIFELAEHAKDRNFEFVEIFTNGNLLNEPAVNEIARLRLKIALSLYGHEAKIHDQVTLREGSFQKTVRAIRLLQEKNVPLRIGVVAMRQNENYMAETINFIHHELGIKDASYDLVRPVGRGCSNELVPKELYQMSIVTEASFPKISYKTFARRVHGHPCFPGKFYVCSNGGVYPCGMETDRILGNIKEQTLSEILENDSTSAIWGLSKDNVDDCGICEYRYACFDCRPKSKEKGNFLAKPKECLYEPRKGEWGKGLGN